MTLNTQKRIIDLSYAIEPRHWRPGWSYELEITKDFARTGHYFRQTKFTIDCHAFTHIDAPAHFFSGERTVDQIPLEQLLGTGVLVDLSHLNANDCVTAEALDRYAPTIESGDMVLIKTLWDQRASHRGNAFFTEAPYMGADACHWLVKQGVKAVGFDFPADYWIRYKYLDSPKSFTREEAVTHDIILREGIVLIESVTNLGALKQERFDLFVIPLKIIGAEGMPVRVVAIEEIRGEAKCRG